MDKAFRVEEHLRIELLSGLDITDSYVRTWVTPDGMPAWYEFRGEIFQGYYKPFELIIHG